MNRNLEEIIEKIMKAVDVINEYGEFVDAYVKQDKSPSLVGNILELSRMYQKKMAIDGISDTYIKVLDNAIKKFTSGDILLELKEPLQNLGFDISEYIDNITPETVKAVLQEAIKNIDKEKIAELANQYQMMGK